MIEIALLELNERDLLFRETAQVSRLSEAIIEKDFWVCFMLEQLFVKSKYKDDLYFKGGTSLSKCYGLIQRFSEDIDIIVDWRILGYNDEEPWQTRSNRSQEKMNEEINNKTNEFLKSTFIPYMNGLLTKQEFKDFKLEMDKNDPLTVLFGYPALYNDTYVKPIVRLEIGALAAKLPIEERKITPYINDYLDGLNADYSFKVCVISEVRTLFEKMTILHGEANRTSNYPIRYARHYYDVYKMLNTSLLKKSLSNIELLNDVVEFKMKFYKSARSKYEEIVEGNLKLVPNVNAIKIYEKDYGEMKHMFFDEIPSFKQIINFLKETESIYNEKIRLNKKQIAR